MAEDRKADRHGEPRRAYQLSDRRWAQFGAATSAIGATRAAVAAELVLWWLGEREHPPTRPKRGQS